MLPLLDGLINSWVTLLSTFLWHGRPEAELTSVAGRAAQLTFLPSAWLIFRGRLWNQGMYVCFGRGKTPITIKGGHFCLCFLVCFTVGLRLGPWDASKPLGSECQVLDHAGELEGRALQCPSLGAVLRSCLIRFGQWWDLPQK